MAGRNIVRSIRRHWIARFINTILGLRDGNLPYDTQCGLKIFRNSTKLECALNGNFRTRWFLDIEILLNSKICKNEIRIWEEPLTDWSDVKGSKLGGIKATVSILLEIIVILRRLGNIKRKIKLN